jgi:glutathione S-transferase
MKLYDLDLSGNCYKIRLFLSILNIPFDLVPVNTRQRENKRPEFLAMNPRGQVPVLDDDGYITWDSSSILVYLARRYGGEPWYPTAPRPAAEVARWLAISQQTEITVTGLSRARAVMLFGTAGDLDDFQNRGRHFLEFLDGYLRGREWIALDHPTIADLACYPYIVMAPQGGVSTEPYGAINAWFARIRALPGYVPPPEPNEGNLAHASGPTGPGLQRAG